MNARDELLARLVAEQHNGGGFKTPPAEWNAGASTAGPLGHVTSSAGHKGGHVVWDDELTTAKRRKVLREAYIEDDVEEAL